MASIYGDTFQPLVEIDQGFEAFPMCRSVLPGPVRTRDTLWSSQKWWSGLIAYFA